MNHYCSVLTLAHSRMLRSHLVTHVVTHLVTHLVAHSLSHSLYLSLSHTPAHTRTPTLSSDYFLTDLTVIDSAHKLALGDFGKAIAINPSQANNYFLRGDCHSKMGNYEQVNNLSLAINCVYLSIFIIPAIVVLLL